MENTFENQTFGVEIEMYNISRENTAKLVADYFGTGAWDSAEELKYHSWACKDHKDRLWQFRRDSSIRPNRLQNPYTDSTPDYSNVCEIVTPVLQGYKDLEDLLNIVQIIIDNGGKSDAGMQCSVHVHVGAEGYNVTGLRELLNQFSMIEPDLANQLDINKYRLLRYCKPLEQDLLDRMNTAKPHKITDFYDLWYDGYEDKRTDHYNKSRYHALNMHSLKCHGTVEYRIFEFKGQMDIEQLREFIMFSIAMTIETKNHHLIDTTSVNDLIEGFDISEHEKQMMHKVFKYEGASNHPITEGLHHKLIFKLINDYSDERDRYL